MVVVLECVLNQKASHHAHCGWKGCSAHAFSLERLLVYAVGYQERRGTLNFDSN